MYFTAAQDDSPNVNMPLKPQTLTYLIYILSVCSFAQENCCFELCLQAVSIVLLGV